MSSALCSIIGHKLQQRTWRLGQDKGYPVYVLVCTRWRCEHVEDNKKAAS